eukprot:gene7318-7530_t
MQMMRQLSSADTVARLLSVHDHGQAAGGSMPCVPGASCSSGQGSSSWAGGRGVSGRSDGGSNIIPSSLDRRGGSDADNQRITGQWPWDRQEYAFHHNHRQDEGLEAEAATAVAANNRSRHAAADSIIAASWSREPPGSSPPGAHAVWGLEYAGLGVAGVLGRSSTAAGQGLGPANDNNAGYTYGPGGGTNGGQQHQQHPFQRLSREFIGDHGVLQGKALHVPFAASASGANEAFAARSSSIPVGGQTRRRSLGSSPSGRLSLSLRHSSTQGALQQGFVASPGQGFGQGSECMSMGSVEVFQGLGGSITASHLLDDATTEAEFYSIAGESSNADELSSFEVEEDRETLDGLPGFAADWEEPEVVDLLPIDGFNKMGCAASKRWRLLCLTAALGRNPGGQESAATDRISQQQAASQVLTLKLALSADLTERAAAQVLSSGHTSASSVNGSASHQRGSKQLVLQGLQVPSVSVSLGALLWDPARGLPAAASSGLYQPASLSQSPGTSSAVQNHEQPQHLGLLAVREVQLVAVDAWPGPGASHGINHNSSNHGSALKVTVSSISCWMSTVRLTLLQNLAHVLQQQQHALSAASIAAGRLRHGPKPGCTTVSGNSVPGSGRGSMTTACGSSNGVELGAASAQAAAVSCSVSIQKLALLCNTDEPDSWLLQAGSRGAACSQAGAACAAITTCSTPLLEAVLSPIQVAVHMATAAGNAGSSNGTVRAASSSTSGSKKSFCVELRGRCQADVYNVDKLGWEPLLDPWNFKLLVNCSPAAAAGCGRPFNISTSLVSNNLLEVTAAPSTIIVAQQLQNVTDAAAAWHSDPALLQQLLYCLAQPGSTTSGAGCWLINNTGTPLTFLVADAATGPAAAARTLFCGNPRLQDIAVPGKAAATSATAAVTAARGVRGRAVHGVPVPLEVLDTAAAGYAGRFVEQSQVSDPFRYFSPGTCGTASHAAPAGAGLLLDATGQLISSGVKRSQLLYVQAAGQTDVAGPIALQQLGCTMYTMRGAGMAASARAAGDPPTAISRRHDKLPHQQQLVVEVSRHRYGGRLVTLHSAVEVLNSSGIALQLGCLSPLGFSNEPLVLGVLNPGQSMWLPLQALQSATPSLCLRPAGLPCSYSWCKPLDVLSLIQAATSSIRQVAGCGVFSWGTWRLSLCLAEFVALSQQELYHHCSRRCQ